VSYFVNTVFLPRRVILSNISYSKKIRDLYKTVK